MDTVGIQERAERELDEYLESLRLRFKPFAESPSAIPHPSQHLEEVLGPHAHLNYLLRQLDEAWESRRLVVVRDIFQEMYEHAEDHQLGLPERMVQVENWLDILRISDSKILLEIERPQVQVVHLLTRINDHFLQMVASNPKLLFTIEPRKFEELIAELFYRDGFEVHLTAQTRDGGRDVIAFTNRMNVATKYIIECKRYAPENAVGIDVVQRLFGVQMAERANKAILATTSRFTGPAKDFINQNIWHLDGKAYDDILRWIAPFKPK